MEPGEFRMLPKNEQREAIKRHNESLRSLPPVETDSISKHLKAFQPDAKRHQEDLKDSSPNLGGTSRRKNKGREITAPLVAQPPLDLESPVEIQTQTQRGISTQQPKDLIVQQAVEGYQDSATLRQATRQLRAIERSVRKRKQQRSRGIETPPEH